jgi:hypothetical protein
MKTLTSFRLPLLAATAVIGFGLTATAQLYPVAYSNYLPGLSADGVSALPTARTNPNNALGVPSNTDVDFGEMAGNSATVDFVSLGFGGSIDLTFAQPFGQCAGPDLQIIETSYGTPACSGWQEYADVFVSQDGCNWVQVADNMCQNFNVELPASMPWGLYVRIVDASPAASFAPNADGYDVDGVIAGCASNMIPVADIDAPRFADAFSNYIVGSTKNGGVLPANRMIGSNTVGTAAGSDAPATPVFASLGFDKASTAGITEGQITLEFFYTVFDRPGDDIRVFETTFSDGAAKPCSNYPEIAEFWGSVDNVNWTLLTAGGTGEPADAYMGGSGRLCRDGWLGIQNMAGGTLRYLKIIDKSIKSSSKFPSAADGYDVDGVYAFGCNPATSGGKYGIYDQNNIPDEDNSIFTMGVFPNPATTTININLETATVDQNYSIIITDMTGRRVDVSTLNAAANTTINHVMSIEHLPAGIYMVSVEANGYKQVNRLIKQ